MHHPATLTLLALTLAIPATARGQAVLDYQFNEVRGATVANAFGPTAFPAFGTLPNSGWQRDPGRSGYSGNDPGYGCLSQNPTGGTNVVDTGAPFVHSGSVTVMFWARRDPSSTASSPFGYFFGDGSFRCFMGSAGVLLGGHGVIRSTLIAPFSGHLVHGVWNHYTIVIDDAAGQAMIYENGVPSTATVSFASGTYVYNGTNNLAIAANGVTSSSRATLHYDMDDFRIYPAAFGPAQIFAAMAGENAAATTSGSGCAGPGGVPAIGSSGGAPAIGNAGFAITVGNLEIGRPQVLNFGLQAAGGALPFDLSTVLGATHAGCFAEVLPDAFSVVLPGSAAATFPLAIPQVPGFAGLHLYAQAVVLGAQGAATPLLDVNVQM